MPDMPGKQVIQNGTYTLTLANLSSNGKVSNVFTDVKVTVSGQTLSFTADGTSYSYTYDYSWGSTSLNEIIAGNGHGGYYIITTSKSNIGTSYKYNYNSDTSKNQWTVTNNGTTYTLSQDSSMSSTGSFDPCFLAGTLIQTPDGLVAVEDLGIGDLVSVTLPDGTAVARKIIWAGSNQKQTFPWQHDDEAGYPVRILKNAISEGVPFKDLLVTAEHCLFLNGHFIPARMLVNGRSISYDRSITSYDYYHVETEDHAIITADGVLTETYLNTGNRGMFSQSGTVVSLSSPSKSWEADAAVPLTTDRAIVEPIFREIEARAEQVAPHTESTQTVLTSDSDLHLLCDNGSTLRPVKSEMGKVEFLLPAGVRSIQIMSRASRPSDVVGPFLDDRRELGVPVGNVTISNAKGTQKITSHQTTASLSGWYPTDASRYRWTAGNAWLSLEERKEDGMAVLSMEIAGSGPYIESVNEAQTALRA
ncbi:Hint domain-containing protein [Gluconobacter thailandicus]|uniref:Hint domain-containing protein n=2 Tax=Gluconobacter thailandicus TaxID=257438 RepID=A0AAP9ESR1_GLUTH|nr:Hint domain-containing protein [Gluconobacter thailandicus]